jgi:hypothetical protein
LCSSGFDNLVLTRSTDTTSAVRKRQGVIYCPYGGYETSSACGQAFSEQQVARHVTAEIYECYNIARMEVIGNAKFFEGMEAEKQKDRKK